MYMYIILHTLYVSCITAKQVLPDELTSSNTAYSRVFIVITVSCICIIGTIKQTVLISCAAKIVQDNRVRTRSKLGKLVGSDSCNEEKSERARERERGKEGEREEMKEERREGENERKKKIFSSLFL